MYPNPSRVICINTYSVDPFFCARNQIWTGDTRIFSPLLYQLSYPDHYRRIILIILDDSGLCQLKMKTKKKRKSIKLKVSNGNFLDLQKEDFVNFHMITHMDYESLNSYRYSLLKSVDLYVYHIYHNISQDLW